MPMPMPMHKGILMDTDKFINAYRAGRNGTDKFYRHALVRRFVYSDGVRECADAGCHWLVDVLATELPAQFDRHGKGSMCIVHVAVANATAEIAGEFEDNDPDPWRKHVPYTDLPTGTWDFFVVDDGSAVLSCILPTEY